jgi:hypothetical protein
MACKSRSRHSIYSRMLGDLSAQGRPVTIRVRVGRWAAGTNDAAARSLLSAFRDLQLFLRVRPTAWRRLSGCSVIAREGVPPRD